jgi:hypothetical protein
LDADCITLNLWQGAAPPVGHALHEEGFRLVVLAAEEYQPTRDVFPAISALALRELNCCSGAEAVAQIQEARYRALCNPTFAGLVGALEKPRDRS